MAPLKLFVCMNPQCAETEGHQRGRPFGFAHTDREPSCPKCGESMANPRYGKKIIQRVTAVHFDPPCPMPGYCMGHRACDPQTSIVIQGGPNGNDPDFMPNPYHAGTGDPEEVTCPSCRATETWRKALALKHAEDPAQAKGAIARMRQFVVAG